MNIGASKGVPSFLIILRGIMLIKRFLEYSKLSTKKTASGMADSTIKSLIVYVQKYGSFTNEYNYDTFLQFLKQSNVSSNSKAFIANSMGRFMWIEGFFSDNDFTRIRSAFRSDHRVWSKQHISNENIAGMMTDIQCNSQNQIIADRNLFVIATLALTGMRVSQLIELNIGDIVITEESIQITIREKKRNSNDLRNDTREINIPINTTILGHSFLVLLLAYLEYVPNAKSANPLIINSNGDRLSIRQVQRFIKNIAVEYGFECTPHTFRHEAITRATNKLGLHTGAILAGHKNISTTMKYVNPEHIDISEVFTNFEEN